MTVVGLSICLPLCISLSLIADSDDETDFVDVDLVVFHDEELHDIATVLKLSDTAKDKVIFTVRTECVFLKAYFLLFFILYMRHTL